FKFYVRQVDNDVAVGYNTEDPLLMWSPLPYYDDGIFTINSDGFRDGEYRRAKGGNVFRILCLGDSSTFGINMALAKIYHKRLESKLNQELGSQDLRFEVINAGVAGYSSLQGLSLYKHKGCLYNPDVVTFYFGINDPVRRFYLSDKEIMQNNTPSFVKTLTNKVLLQSASYRVLRKAILSLVGSSVAKWRGNKARVSREDYKNNILEIDGLCRRNGSRLILISPCLCKDNAEDWERYDDVIAYRKVLEETARDFRIPLITIDELTERAEAPSKDYFHGKTHPNKYGHELIARRLYDYLVSNVLSTPQRQPL
ncbi:MAG: SGNH/GDSL hydrolase family protein, partial [bacterium]